MKRLKPSDCWIIVPAHNEERRIADVVARCRKRGFTQIVVVDDGSRDRTAQKARLAGAVVLRHIVNLHKGGAMLTGSRYALQEGAKALIFLDGDGQHAPEELPRFLEELNRGHDIVFGARRVTADMPIVRRLGKILTYLAIRVLYGVKVHDVLSGYRAVRASAFDKIAWSSRDYSVESEMVARAGKAGLRYAEITISTIYHDKYKGMTFLDAIPLFWNLLWWRLTLRKR